ncbi:MAG: GyrI-like domain-containing protein, partial [Desulfovibrio sp.]|nr:GyrI-like domain-containing protein [Desulfovibrio sp.]
PLEGFWWQEGGEGMDYGNKAALNWISCIRLPEFITPGDLAWAVARAAEKKRTDCSAAEFLTIDEGLCVQMMHRGPFDAEPASVAAMDEYLAESGFMKDLGGNRLHHEIYLSDARRVPPEKWKTVLRQPIRKTQGSPRS